MNRVLLVCVCVGSFAVSLAIGAAPSSVSDSLLYQMNDRRGPVAPTMTSLTLLRADGTYQELWINEFVIAPGVNQPVSSGTYTYVVSNSDSTQATLTLGSTARTLTFGDAVSGTVDHTEEWTFRIFPSIASAGAVNVSNRAWVSPTKTAITGFVVGGDVDRWVLLRAAGPALTDMGVPVVVASPQLKLFKGQTELGSFARWSADANLVAGFNAVFDLTSAFPFAAGSADCAALVRLEPGSYTMHSLGATSDAEVLMEVYVLPYGG